MAAELFLALGRVHGCVRAVRRCGAHWPPSPGAPHRPSRPSDECRVLTMMLRGAPPAVAPSLPRLGGRRPPAPGAHSWLSSSAAVSLVPCRWRR